MSRNLEEWIEAGLFSFWGKGHDKDSEQQMQRL